MGSLWITRGQGGLGIIGKGKGAAGVACVEECTVSSINPYDIGVGFSILMFVRTNPTLAFKLFIP